MEQTDAGPPKRSEQQSEANTRGGGEDGPLGSGINLITVLIMLAVLLALVVLVFWAIPQWFGARTINVNIRG